MRAMLRCDEMRISDVGLSPIITVRPEEIDAIAARFDADKQQLAALEALAHPRLAYEWKQAGGPANARLADVSAEALETARRYCLSFRKQ